MTTELRKTRETPPVTPLSVTPSRLPSQVPQWIAQIAQDETEVYVLSGCLQNPAMLDAMRPVLPARAFKNPWHRVTWVTMCNLSHVSEKALVKAIRHAVEALEHDRTGRWWQGFYEWFSGLISASPAPCWTSYHVRSMLHRVEGRPND